MLSLGVVVPMDDRRIRHIPVVDDGKLAGIVNIRNIVMVRRDETTMRAAAGT